MTRLLNLNYVADDESLLTDPRVFPGEGATSGLPPTVIANSEADDLRASGERFSEPLVAAGVEVDVSFEPRASHGHLNEPEQPYGARTFATAHRWLVECLNGSAVLAHPVPHRPQKGATHDRPRHRV